MSEGLMNQNQFQCVINDTNYIISNSDKMTRLPTLICGFIANFVVGFGLIVVRTVIQKTKRKSAINTTVVDKKTIHASSTGSTFVIMNSRSRYKSASCPVNRFQPTENAATLSVRKLQEITENEIAADVESPLEYGPGGYMPCYTGQLIGSNKQHKIIRKLGWGHFSTVWLCENMSQPGNYNAIKIVKASNAFKSVALDEIKLLKCVREKDATHDGYNRVILLQEYFTEISINGPHICLMFELMGPSLLDLIIQSDYQGIEQPAARSIIKQILEGLVYLHEVCRIIHTDIKPENILIKVKESYVRNMVDHVNRFHETGVQMPKSYVNSMGWATYVELFGEPSNSKFENASDKYRTRDTSCPSSPDKSYVKNVPKSSENTLSSPMFVDPNIQVKIADLGNSCWEHKHYSKLIQTIQYRALEVIIEAEYSFPADIWSVACVAFEMCTGEYLFNPRQTPCLSNSEDHLGLIWEVLDGIPKYVVLGGQKSKNYFDESGMLKNIKKENMKIWKVEDVLVDKYGWKRVEAILFADFIQALIEPDPDLRTTASAALTKKWLKELDNQ